MLLVLHLKLAIKTRQDFIEPKAGKFGCEQQQKERQRSRDKNNHKKIQL